MGKGLLERFGLVRTADVQARINAAIAATPKPNAEDVARAIMEQTGIQPAPYAYNNAHLYAQASSPERRPLAPVSVTTLRALADNYDILRACIEHLKREVATVPVVIQSRIKKQSGDAIEARIRQAEALFTLEGPVGRAQTEPEHFEQAMLEDAIVIGSPAIFHRYARGGQWLWCDTIDAATVLPVLDDRGWEMEGGLYHQYVQGIKVATLTGKDLSVDKLAAVSWQPYSRSPVEWLIHSVNRALRIDGWNLTWFTDGTTPADMVGLPQDWGVDDVIKFSNWYNALLSGNITERLKVRFVPGGTTRLGSKASADTDFTPQELWLLRRTCAIMGVQPASIGFTGEQYKVSQDESMHATTRFGAGVLLRLRKRRYDDILRRAGFGDLETVLPQEQTEKPKEKAEREAIEISSGKRTINEVRADAGLDSIEGGDVTLVQGTLKPLNDVLVPPDPNNPDPTQRAALIRQELRRWERKALRCLQESSSALCSFDSEALEATLVQRLTAALPGATTPDAIKALFRAEDSAL